MPGAAEEAPTRCIGEKRSCTRKGTYLLLLRLALQPLHKLFFFANLSTITGVVVINRHLHRLQVISPPRLSGRFFGVRLRYFQNFGGEPAQEKIRMSFAHLEKQDKQVQQPRAPANAVADLSRLRAASLSSRGKFSEATFNPSCRVIVCHCRNSSGPAWSVTSAQTSARKRLTTYQTQ